MRQLTITYKKAEDLPRIGEVVVRREYDAGADSVTLYTEPVHDWLNRNTIVPGTFERMSDRIERLVALFWNRLRDGVRV